MIFDDKRSVIHVVTSALSVLLHINVSLTILFIAYEYIEPEDVGHKLGDLVEWGVGLIAGGITRLIMAHLGIHIM